MNSVTRQLRKAYPTIPSAFRHIRRAVSGLDFVSKTRGMYSYMKTQQHHDQQNFNSLATTVYEARPLTQYQQKLLTEVKLAVARERHSTLAVLQLLRKIEVEKIYAIIGYSSLWDFTVKELGYSHDGAYRRISAMRLLKDIPQVKEKIERGTLSLTAAAQLQKFIRAEEKANNVQNTQSAQNTQTAQTARNRLDRAATDNVNVERALNYGRKVEILSKIDGQSSREVNRILLAEASASTQKQLVMKCTEKPVSQTLTEVTMTLDHATIEKLHQIKDALSHSLSHQNQGQVDLITTITKLIDDAHKKIAKPNALTCGDAKGGESTINQKEPRQMPAKQMPAKQMPAKQMPMPATSASASMGKEERNAHKNDNDENSGAPKVKSASWTLKYKRAYISNKLKRQVYQKFNGQCQYAGCGSRAFLQVDHKIPVSKGGTNGDENLTLLCGTHNRLKGTKGWGRTGTRLNHSKSSTALT